MVATATRRFQFEGRERSCVVHRPASATQPFQAVMALHGAHGSGAKFWADRWRDRWANSGFILVLPDAEVHSMDGLSATAWVHEGTEYGDDPAQDERFLTAIIDRVNVRDWYLCGFSSGGGLVGHMMVRAPGAFAAFGISSASRKVGLDAVEAPVYRPTMFICGTDDPEQWDPEPDVHMGAENTVEWIRGRCECSAQYDEESRRGFKATARIRSYQGCSHPVRSIIVEDGGHAWFNVQNHGVSTDSEFVEFFTTAGLRVVPRV